MSRVNQGDSLANCDRPCTKLTASAAKERLQKVAGQLAPTEGDMDGKSSSSGGRGRASVLSKNPDDVRK